MITKTFEIRDRATFIPALAIRLEPGNERDRFLLARAGFGLRPEDQYNYVMLAPISGGGDRITSDPHQWGDRTYLVAHQYLVEHFDELESGAVVDVEFILGEKAEPSESEAR